MAIKTDLTHLPSPAKTSDAGHAPDAKPRFAHLLVEQWRDEEERKGPLARAHPDSRFRHSDAGKCARAVAYAALDIAPSDPMDLSGFWNTGLGRIIHQLVQAAIEQEYPGAQIETKVRTDGADGSGHIDAVVRMPDGPVVAIEIKSIGGFAFKLAVGERGAAQGPKLGHQYQAALNAASVDADEAVIVYLSKEAISVNAAKKKGFDEIARFAAEWTLTREQYQPLAAVEANRVAKILEVVDTGELPKRVIPGAELPTGHEIIDAKTGRWEVRGEDGKVVDTGTWWECSYCSHQTLCDRVGPGRVAVDQLVEITKAVA